MSSSTKPVAAENGNPDDTTGGDNDKFDWPPLESNPQVMTDYLRQIGLAPGYAIGEIYGFDEDLLAFVPQPVLGVIVALERKKREMDVQRGDDTNLNLPFYMKQAGTLDNACGIIACLHAILNNAHASSGGEHKNMILPDTVLAQFQATTASQTPEQRCNELESNSAFRTVHRNFASQGQSQAITHDQSKVKHHYVAFVVHDGQLIELDGTKRGPFVVAEKCGDVLRGAITSIQARLAAGEISEQLSMMTLSAVIDDD